MGDEIICLYGWKNFNIKTLRNALVNGDND